MANTPLNEYIAALLSEAAYTPPTTTDANITGDGKVRLSDLGWMDISETLKSEVKDVQGRPIYYYDTPSDPAHFSNEFRVLENSE